MYQVRSTLLLLLKYTSYCDFSSQELLLHSPAPHCLAVSSSTLLQQPFFQWRLGFQIVAPRQCQFSFPSLCNPAGTRLTYHITRKACHVRSNALQLFNYRFSNPTLNTRKFQLDGRCGLGSMPRRNRATPRWSEKPDIRRRHTNSGLVSVHHHSWSSLHSSADGDMLQLCYDRQREGGRLPVLRSWHSTALAEYGF